MKFKNYEIMDYENPLTKDIINSCKKAYQKNKLFFGGDSHFFKITICHTEKEFKKRIEDRYYPWAKGGRLKNNDIVIRSPDNVLSNYKQYGGTKSFDTILIHEINHVFTCGKFMKKGPLWLFEGLAMYLANQRPKNSNSIIKKATPKIFFYKYSHKKWDKYHLIAYPAYYLFTYYLIKKYGKQKLLNLIKASNKNTKKKDYEKNFQKVYNKKEKEMINEFLK